MDVVVFLVVAALAALGLRKFGNLPGIRNRVQVPDRRYHLMVQWCGGDLTRCGRFRTLEQAMAEAASMQRYAVYDTRVVIRDTVVDEDVYVWRNVKK